MSSATKILTAKSPNDRVNQGTPVAEKDIEKNKKVSTVEPIKEDVKGAINHFFLLNLSKIWTSNNWATIKAVPEPIAILIEIKSVKLVENNSVKEIPIANPTYTIFLATIFP